MNSNQVRELCDMLHEARTLICRALETHKLDDDLERYMESFVRRVDGLTFDVQLPEGSEPLPVAIRMNTANEQDI